MIERGVTTAFRGIRKTSPGCVRVVGGAPADLEKTFLAALRNRASPRRDLRRLCRSREYKISAASISTQTSPKHRPPRNSTRTFLSIPLGLSASASKPHTRSPRYLCDLRGLAVKKQPADATDATDAINHYLTAPPSPARHKSHNIRRLHKSGAVRIVSALSFV